MWHSASHQPIEYIFYPIASMINNSGGKALYTFMLFA